MLNILPDLLIINQSDTDLIKQNAAPCMGAPTKIYVTQYIF